jgi:hypothetical protein
MGTLLRFRPQGRLAACAAIALCCLILLPVLGLAHALRNPFAETTTLRSSPTVLRSITALSRYEADNGTFQVVVDLQKGSPHVPSFIEGSQTIFVGEGTDIAYVDFSRLSGRSIQVSADRTAVTVILPQPQLQPAVLDISKSHVFNQQEGLLGRLGNLLGSSPDSQRAVYLAAQRQVQAAARHSSLVAAARKNTSAMLHGLLGGLGFRHVTVRFAGK